MNLFILASFLILVIMVHHSIHQNSKYEKKAEEEYWEKEAQANFVRKKSLDGLDYIRIPDEILNLKSNLQNQTTEISACLEKLSLLSEQKIVNLTGISNTDLKLAYGTANITILSEYDLNYTELATTLQKLAEALLEINEKKLAILVLEFAIDTGSDISKTFFMLADLYQESGEAENIDLLIQRAEETHTLMKETILNTLRQNRLADGQ